MKKKVFTGSGVAIITPFTETGVNYDELGKMLDYHLENKTDAIVICGTTGEASTLSHAEHLQAIKYTVDKVAKRVPVIAGTSTVISFLFWHPLKRNTVNKQIDNIALFKFIFRHFLLIFIIIIFA